MMNCGESRRPMLYKPDVFGIVSKLILMLGDENNILPNFAP